MPLFQDLAHLAPWRFSRFPPELGLFLPPEGALALLEFRAQKFLRRPTIALRQFRQFKKFLGQRCFRQSPFWTMAVRMVAVCQDLRRLDKPYQIHKIV